MAWYTQRAQAPSKKIRKAVVAGTTTRIVKMIGKKFQREIRSTRHAAKYRNTIRKAKLGGIPCSVEQRKVSEESIKIIKI